jgi:DNA-binding MarR family transcriptional regulator
VAGRAAHDGEGEAHPGEPWYDEVALPALLRGARATYRTAIRQALAQAGFEDLPRNGSFVIGGLARTGAPLARIVRDLGVSKQAASQLVDTLVARRYLRRAVDPADRRRLVILLAERGEAAAVVVRDSVDKVDSALAARVGPGPVAEARRTLGALMEMASVAEERGHQGG